MTTYLSTVIRRRVQKNREKTCTDLAEISYIHITYVMMSHIPTYTVYIGFVT